MIEQQQPHQPRQTHPSAVSLSVPPRHRTSIRWTSPALPHTLLLLLAAAILLSHLHPTSANSGLNTLVGIRGTDFVLLGGDTSFFRGVTVMDGAYKKVVQLAPTLAAAAAGEQGDVEVFLDWLTRHLALRRLGGETLPVSSVAHLARRDIAASLRRRPQAVNLLLGGWDPQRGPQLYWIDQLGALQPVPYGAHGAASAFVLSALDRAHRDSSGGSSDGGGSSGVHGRARALTRAQAVALVRACVRQLAERYIVHGGGFQMVVIDARGCRDVGCGDALLAEEGGAQEGEEVEVKDEVGAAAAAGGG